MPTPATAKPFSPATSPWQTLRADPIVLSGLGLFVVTAALYLIAAPELLSFVSRRLAPFLFLTLVIVALTWRLARLKVPGEREFWWDLIRAFGCWWTAAAAILAFPAPAKPFAVDFATSVLYGLYYIAFLMAVERQPHRRHRWRPVALERRLNWLTATAVVAGLFLYFPFISSWSDRQEYASGIPDLYLYLTLDGYLTLRLVFLLRAARTRRWRLTYALLAAATLSVFANDLIEALDLAHASQLWSWETFSNVLLFMPYLFFVIAARLRHHRFPWEAPPRADRIRLEDSLPGPLGQTMIFVLVFPLIHFFCYQFELLDETAKPWRELLIVFWLPVLGVIAWTQYRALEKTIEELKGERQTSERALYKAQEELRVAQQRQQTMEALRSGDERFREAFRACPAAMIVSRVSDGQVVEVNEGCLRVFGYEPEEILGRTSGELGLWSDPEDRAYAVSQLRRHGEVTMEVEYFKKSSRKGIGVVSAHAIEIDGEPHLFSITRDVTKARQRQEELGRKAVLLDEAASAIWAVGDDGHVTYWNAAAERAYGWRAGDITGREVPSLEDAESPAVETRDGHTVAVDSLSIPVDAYERQPGSRLVISTLRASRRDEGA